MAEVQEGGLLGGRGQRDGILAPMQGKEQGEVDGRSDGAFGKMRTHTDMKHKEALNSGENQVTQGRSCTLRPLWLCRDWV